MKRMVTLVAINLFLCSTASAFQDGGGKSTKNPKPTPKPSPTSAAKPKVEPPKRSSTLRPSPVPTVTNGVRQSLAAFRGKVVILNFFATWAGPCREQTAVLVALQNKYRDQGLEVVGVSIDPIAPRGNPGGALAVAPFMKDNGINYHVWMIDNVAALRGYDVSQGIPTTYVLDREGRIVKTYVFVRPIIVYEDDIKQMLNKPGSNSSTKFLVEGLPDPPPGQEFEGPYRVCTPGYFQTIGIRLIQGRLFSDYDKADTPLVVIVNEALAKTYWPNQDAIGRRIRLSGQIDRNPWREVIGVIANLKHDIGIPVTSELYFPVAQDPWSKSDNTTPPGPPVPPSASASQSVETRISAPSVFSATPSGASSTAPTNVNSRWLDGGWEGSAYQINTRTTWAIKLTVQNNAYSVEYPSLSCGGEWVLVDKGLSRAKFKETITYGVDGCVNDGEVTIERISDTKVAFKYTEPNSTVVMASSILSRK